MDTSADEVLHHCLEAADLASIRSARALHGYQRAAEVHRGSVVIASLLWGGNGDGCHVWSSGGFAAWLAGVVRSQYAAHEVTRFDSAIDFRGAAWVDVERLAFGVADRERVSVTHYGDFHRGEKGRTLYLGAPSSVVRVRIYEKGIKEGGPPDWVRAEVQVRPKNNRTDAARLTESEAWGCSRWSGALYTELTGAKVERFRCGTIYRPTDAERAIAFMLKQYGDRLRQRTEEVGATTVLEQLEEVIYGTDDKSTC